MAIAATQKWYMAAAGASAAVLAAGWFLMVSPQQATAADINAQAASVASANAATENQIASLKVQYKDLPALQSQVAAIAARLPQTPNEPTLLRTMSAAAAKAGVSLVSMQVQTPTVLAGAGAGAPGSTPLSAPGVVSQIPLTIEVMGPFANTSLFLNSLEGMQRVILVTGVDVARASSDVGKSTAKNDLRTTLTARVFMANPGAYVSASSATTTGVASADQPS